MREDNQILIMDFSGVYGLEEFYREEPHVILDLGQIPGTNCYCDEEAGNLLRERIRDFSPEGVRFLDSGNYHYMTRIWLEKIHTPFRLLVFDHHTDMQPPAFGGLLSCGGWIADALTELPLLRRVDLCGPGKEEFMRDRASLGEAGERVHLFSPEEESDLPLYLSIDKDVLCMEDASTGWSQGNMRLGELLAVLKSLGEKNTILGADICGECAREDFGKREDMRKNDRANRAILEVVKGWSRRGRLHEE